MELVLSNCFPPRMAIQITGHQPNPKIRFTICSGDACFKGNTKVELGKDWVSHLLVDTSLEIGAHWFLD